MQGLSGDAGRGRMSDLMPTLNLMEQGPEIGAVIRGAILAESLKPGTGFDGHGMRITRCARYEVTGVAERDNAQKVMVNNITVRAEE